jgi:hypothetical protein
MKTPSHFAASGNASRGVLAEQVARERSSNVSKDLLPQHQFVPAGSLVEMLLRWTRVAGTSPRNTGESHYISDDRNRNNIFEERK